MNFPNYIHGEWVTGATFENHNPANTDEVVGDFSKAKAADVEAAAEAAEKALPGWAGMSAPARGNNLYKAADLLEQRFEQSLRRHDPRRRQDPARSQGRGAPQHQHPPLFRRRRLAHAGVLVPSERDRVHMFAIRKPSASWA